MVLRNFIALFMFGSILISTDSVEAFAPRSEGIIAGVSLVRPVSQSRTRLAQSRQEPEEETEDQGDDEKKQTPTEPISLVELSRLEQESSKRVMDRLLLPQRIGQAVTSAAWFFVGLGFVLNIFGYGYVKKDGFITIDILENQAFQRELNKPSVSKVVRDPLQ